MLVLTSGPLHWLMASLKLFSMSLKQSPIRFSSLTLSSCLQLQHLLPAIKQSNIPCSQISVTSIPPRTFSFSPHPFSPVTIYSLLGTRDWCYETVMPDGGVEISLLGLESSCKYR